MNIFHLYFQVDDKPKKKLQVKAKKEMRNMDEVDKVSAFHGFEVMLEFKDDDHEGKSGFVQGKVESYHPSGILTLYYVKYMDKDVGLLDPEETKKQVDLRNKINDSLNEDYDDEIVKQEIKVMGKEWTKGSFA